MVVETKTDMVCFGSVDQETVSIGPGADAIEFFVKGMVLRVCGFQKARYDESAILLVSLIATQSSVKIEKMLGPPTVPCEQPRSMLRSG